jgi:hypothetical protein
MNTIWKLASISTAAIAAACSHTTTREIVHEQPIVQQQPVAQQQPTTVERTIVLQPPPAPQETMTAPPAATGYTWVPGHWAFREGTWQWESGSWHAGVVPPMPALVTETIPAAPMSNSRWVPGYWSYSSDRWNWVKGHWE